MDQTFPAVSVNLFSNIDVEELRKQIAENFEKIDLNIQELKGISSKISTNSK